MISYFLIKVEYWNNKCLNTTLQTLRIPRIHNYSFILPTRNRLKLFLYQNEYIYICRGCNTQMYTHRRQKPNIMPCRHRDNKKC